VVQNGVPVFQDLLQRYFVENTHQATVNMKPVAGLEERRLAEETALLAGIKQGMSPEQLQEVIAQAQQLREAQEAADSPEARATLPRLSLSDIDPAAKEYPLEVLSGDALRTAGIHDATVLLHELQTSGILYADLALDYSGIDAADLELLPLFTRMLMESGTTQYDLATLTRKIGTSTGGISVSLHNDLRANGNKVVAGDQALLHLLVRGKAVKENLPVLFQLFADILLTADLGNQKRAVEMLRESKARKESAVLTSGHTFAATRLSSRQSFLGHLNELTGGLTSVRQAGALLEQATSDWSSVEARLQRMRSAIIQRRKDGLVVNLTGDAQLLASTLPHVKTLVDALPKGPKGATKSVVASWQRPGPNGVVNEAFVMPSQVNYVALGGPILPPGSEVRGGYSVATRYLSTGHLWDQVRVVGGAYGGFARFSETTGRFVYLSYRDPNCLETLNAYDASPDALSEAELTSEDLLQAIIGTVGDLDAPLSADPKGLTSLTRYLNGEAAADRQRKRSEILATSAEDFKTFAEHLRQLRETGAIVVFGAQPAVEAANSQLPQHRRMVVEQALLGAVSSVTAGVPEEEGQ
jgi:Zn-dependent M16 (insulinase) family peptidase